MLLLLLLLLHEMKLSEWMSHSMADCKLPKIIHIYSCINISVVTHTHQYLAVLKAYKMALWCTIMSFSVVESSSWQFLVRNGQYHSFFFPILNSENLARDLVQHRLFHSIITSVIATFIMRFMNHKSVDTLINSLSINLNP